MKILILNWKDIKHPEVGGAEIIVYELSKRLAKDGHDVTWFSRGFKNGKPNHKHEGINLVRRGNLVTMYLWAPIYYWKLERKPDIVVDMSNTIYWQTPLWAIKSKRVAYLNQLAKEVFDYEFPKLIGEFGKLVERFQYLTYQKTPFICYSKSTKDDLISMRISRNKIYTFPLGLDHKRYVPGEKAKYPLFICVSRLVKMKRTDLAIKAFKIVSEKYGDAKLVIVGYGYERENLEKLRNKLGLKNSIEFIDKDNLFFKKNVMDQKVKLMQQAWALIFPSVKEGWGMTVTECAACGTPTIATSVTGLKDSVVDNKTGILVSSNPTPDKLSKEIIKLIERPKLRKELSESALVRAKSFTWNRSYKEFMKILESI